VAKRKHKAETQRITDDAWVDRKTCALWLRISLTHFEREYQSRFGDGDKVKEGNKWWFRGLPLANLIREQERASPRTHGSSNGPDDDPAMAGPVTAALEDYRRQRAELARLDVLERKKQLIPTDQVHEAMATIARILRNAGETLVKHHGQEAGEVMDEAVDEILNTAERYVGDDDGAHIT